MYKAKLINLKSILVLGVLAFAMAAFVVMSFFVQSNAQEQNGYTIDVEFSYQQGYVTSTRQNLPYVEESNRILAHENTLYLGHNQLIATAAEGYSFVGWYLNGQKLEDEVQYITSDSVFYAKFASSVIKLQFNATADSPEDCEVRPSELTIACGSKYTVNGDIIEFKNETKTERVKAYIHYEAREQLDYWLMDGVKINNKDTGIVYEGHVFTAHFSYKETTEVSGIVKDSQGVPCPNATVCSKIDRIDSSDKIDNIVHTDAEGKYKIPLLTPPKEKINLFAANEDGAGQATITSKESEADIIVSSDSTFNIISGTVTAHETSANENITLAQADVMFQFTDDTSSYLYARTNANGEYAFIIPNQDHNSGVLVCNPARYIIDGSKIEGIKGTAKLLKYNYEMWQGENIQIRYFPYGYSWGDYYETKLEISDGNNKVEFNAKITEDLHISLPSGDTNVNVDGEIITLNSNFDNPLGGKIHVKYQVVPNYDEGEQFTCWKCNGVILGDYSDFTLTESLDFDPIVAKLISITGLVCDRAGQPLEGVTIAFLNNEDYVISQTESNGDAGTNFTLNNVPAGSSGDILFVKEGKEPKPIHIKQEQTQEDRDISDNPVYLNDGEVGARYIVGRITDSASSANEDIPVAGARISFTYGSNHDYLNAVSTADGSYLIKIQDPGRTLLEGYFGVIAHGYKSKFKDNFLLDSKLFVTHFDLQLEKYTNEFCDVSFSQPPNVQKLQLCLSHNWSARKAIFDIPSDFAISIDKNVYKIAEDNDKNVLHIQENAEHPTENDFYISAIPTDLYKVSSWNINPQPDPTIKQNTSCNPNIVMKTSDVVLNAGEGVNRFNYKYYINGETIWDVDLDVVEDASYLNTEITVDKNGVVRSKLVVEPQSKNEADVLTSVVTPYIDESYEFDSLIVNEKELVPGDSIIVEEGMTYNAQLNFKYVEHPVPPTPDDPGTGGEIANAQTGDFNLFTIVGLTFAIAVIAFAIFANRKQTY